MTNARDVPGMIHRLVDALSVEEIALLKENWTAGKSLRVATVCSGTDAPIIGLEMLLADALKQQNIHIKLKHIFSCESVPFKREFIIKTSDPPILFNDVTELANGVGACHDGIERTVPKDFDVLIAGTECVDFSSLSTTPKGLNDKKGRSSITFFATLELVKLRQPSIVILENVAKCPAKEMKQAFCDAGYEGVCCKVCTSDYFLPQSRQRMYFFFRHRTKTKSTDVDWAKVMQQLGPNRPSQPDDKALEWTDFLRDEVNLRESNQTRKRKRGGKSLEESSGTKWLAEIKAVEKKEGLVPYNKEGGRPYSTATKDCAALAALPDRAKLRLDVQHKRAEKIFIDPLTTPLLWNPAQQLRFTDAKPWLRTIAPCVTPKHEWIVSSRKGPLSGRECLDLQGISVKEEALESFDDAQLRDLAGNAMSIPVITAACIAALVSCQI